MAEGCAIVVSRAHFVTRTPRARRAAPGFLLVTEVRKEGRLFEDHRRGTSLGRSRAPEICSVAPLAARGFCRRETLLGSPRGKPSNDPPSEIVSRLEL